MAIFLTNIDLKKNELQNAALHKLGIPPASPVEGQIYYDTNDGHFYIFNGTLWTDPRNRSSHVGQQFAITISDFAAAADARIAIANITQSRVTNLTTDLAAKAPLASAALTGAPTAPTAVAGTNTTQIATTAFTQAAVAALVASSPAALDTLNELAAALGNDANFAATTSTALGLKMVKTANLSDVTSVPTARTNLGLGTAATLNVAASGNAAAGEVVKGNDTRLAVASALRFSQDIGDAAATVFVVTHNLGTRDINAQVRENSGAYAFVGADIEATTANTATVRFAAAPAAAAYRVTILG